MKNKKRRFKLLERLNRRLTGLFKRNKDKNNRAGNKSTDNSQSSNLSIPSDQILIMEQCPDIHKMYDSISSAYYYEQERSNNINNTYTHQLTIIAGFITILVFFLTSNFIEIKRIYCDGLKTPGFLKADILTLIFVMFFMIYVLITFITLIRIVKCMYRPDVGQSYVMLESNTLGYYIQDLKHMKFYLICVMHEMMKVTTEINKSNNKLLHKLMINTSLLFYNSICLVALLVIYTIIELGV